MVSRGGLGREISYLVKKNNLNINLNFMNLKDEFIHCYGSHDDILAEHNLTETALLSLLNDNS